MTGLYPVRAGTVMPMCMFAMGLLRPITSLLYGLREKKLPALMSQAILLGLWIIMLVGTVSCFLNLILQQR